MIAALRIASLLSGAFLVGSLPLFIFAFAASVGDLDGLSASTFLEPLKYTVPMGVGNVLVGFPYLVSGERNPILRAVGGSLLVLSCAITLFASIAFWPLIICVALQVALFAVFVWPAKHFRNA